MNTMTTVTNDAHVVRFAVATVGADTAADLTVTRRLRGEGTTTVASPVGVPVQAAPYSITFDATGASIGGFMTTSTNPDLGPPPRGRHR